MNESPTYRILAFHGNQREVFLRSNDFNDIQEEYEYLKENGYEPIVQVLTYKDMEME